MTLLKATALAPLRLRVAALLLVAAAARGEDEQRAADLARRLAASPPPTHVGAAPGCDAPKPTNPGQFVCKGSNTYGQTCTLQCPGGWYAPDGSYTYTCSAKPMCGSVCGPALYGSGCSRPPPPGQGKLPLKAGCGGSCGPVTTVPCGQQMYFYSTSDALCDAAAAKWVISDCPPVFSPLSASTYRWMCSPCSPPMLGASFGILSRTVESGVPRIGVEYSTGRFVPPLTEEYTCGIGTHGLPLNSTCQMGVWSSTTGSPKNGERGVWVPDPYDAMVSKARCAPCRLPPSVPGLIVEATAFNGANAFVGVYKCPGGTYSRSGWSFISRCDRNVVNTGQAWPTPLPADVAAADCAACAEPPAPPAGVALTVTRNAGGSAVTATYTCNEVGSKGASTSASCDAVTGGWAVTFPVCVPPSPSSTAMPASVTPTASPAAASASASGVPPSASASASGVPPSASASASSVPPSASASASGVPPSASASPSGVPPSASASGSAAPAEPSPSPSSSAAAAVATSSGPSGGSGQDTTTLDVALLAVGARAGHLSYEGAPALAQLRDALTCAVAALAAPVAPAAVTATIAGLWDPTTQASFGVPDLPAPGDCVAVAAPSSGGSQAWLLPWNEQGLPPASSSSSGAGSTTSFPWTAIGAPSSTGSSGANNNGLACSALVAVRLQLPRSLLNPALAMLQALATGSNASSSSSPLQGFVSALAAVPPEPVMMPAVIVDGVAPSFPPPVCAGATPGTAVFPVVNVTSTTIPATTTVDLRKPLSMAKGEDPLSPYEEVGAVLAPHNNPPGAGDDSGLSGAVIGALAALLALLALCAFLALFALARRRRRRREQAAAGGLASADAEGVVAVAAPRGLAKSIVSTRMTGAAALVAALDCDAEEAGPAVVGEVGEPLYGARGSPTLRGVPPARGNDAALGSVRLAPGGSVTALNPLRVAPLPGSRATELTGLAPARAALLVAGPGEASGLPSASRRVLSDDGDDRAGYGPMKTSRGGLGGRSKSPGGYGLASGAAAAAERDVAGESDGASRLRDPRLKQAFGPSKVAVPNSRSARSLLDGDAALAAEHGDTDDTSTRPANRIKKAFGSSRTAGTGMNDVLGAGEDPSAATFEALEGDAALSSGASKRRLKTTFGAVLPPALPTASGAAPLVIEPARPPAVTSSAAAAAAAARTMPGLRPSSKREFGQYMAPSNGGTAGSVQRGGGAMAPPQPLGASASSTAVSRRNLLGGDGGSRSAFGASSSRGLDVADAAPPTDAPAIKGIVPGLMSFLTAAAEAQTTTRPRDGSK